eukprot:3294230-Rhodomonas_salina.1
MLIVQFAHRSRSGTRTIARTHDVPRTTVQRILAEFRLLGHVFPKTMYRAGRPLRANHDQKIEWVLKWLNDMPLETHSERAKFATAGLNWLIHEKSIARILREQGVSRKRVNAIDERRDDWERFNFVMQVAALHLTQDMLVCVDEVSMNTKNLFRGQGYAPQGELCDSQGPYMRSDSVSVWAAMSTRCVEALHSVTGTWNGLNFIVAVEEYLLKSGVMTPYPGPRSVLAADNVRIHHSYNNLLVHVCAQYGVQVIFLPAYSPDMNPIELLFGWSKKEMGSIQEEWWRAGLGEFTDIWEGMLLSGSMFAPNWFAHSGWV